MQVFIQLLKTLRREDVISTKEQKLWSALSAQEVILLFENKTFNFIIVFFCIVYSSLPDKENLQIQFENIGKDKSDIYQCFGRFYIIPTFFYLIQGGLNLILDWYEKQDDDNWWKSASS